MPAIRKATVRDFLAAAARATAKEPRIPPSEDFNIVEAYRAADILLQSWSLLAAGDAVTEDLPASSDEGIGKKLASLFRGSDSAQSAQYMPRMPDDYLVEIAAAIKFATLIQNKADTGGPSNEAALAVARDFGERFVYDRNCFIYPDKQPHTKKPKAMVRAEQRYLQRKQRGMDLVGIKDPQPRSDITIRVDFSSTIDGCGQLATSIKEVIEDRGFHVNFVSDRGHASAGENSFSYDDNMKEEALTIHEILTRDRPKLFDYFGVGGGAHEARMVVAIYRVP